MNVETAPVMGCSYLGQDIKTQVDTLAQKSKDINNMLYQYVSEGANVFTPQRAQAVQAAYADYKQAIDHLATAYPDANLYDISPNSAKVIQDNAQNIILNIQKIGKWSPDVGAVGMELRQEIDALIANAQLDNPLIAPHVKKTFIDLAYGQAQSNPAMTPIRDKYNPDGSLKSGEEFTPVTREITIQEMQKRYAAQGLTYPGLAQIAPETPAGIPGGLIAAGIAGIVAFFALRG